MLWNSSSKRCSGRFTRTLHTNLYVCSHLTRPLRPKPNKKRTHWSKKKSLRKKGTKNHIDSVKWYYTAIDELRENIHTHKKIDGTLLNERANKNKYVKHLYLDKVQVIRPSQALIIRIFECLLTQHFSFRWLVSITTFKLSRVFIVSIDSKFKKQTNNICGKLA